MHAHQRSPPRGTATGSSSYTWILQISPALYSSLGYSSTSQIHDWCDFSLLEGSLYPSNPWTQLASEKISARKKKTRKLPLTLFSFSVEWLVINFFIKKNLQKSPHRGTHDYSTFIFETRVSLRNNLSLEGVPQTIICERTMASMKCVLKQQKSSRGEQEKLKTAEAASSGRESQIHARFPWSETQHYVGSILCLRQSLRQKNWTPLHAFGG